jgi:hypothetical protein
VVRLEDFEVESFVFRSCDVMMKAVLRRSGPQYR